MLDQFIARHIGCSIVDPTHQTLVIERRPLGSPEPEKCQLVPIRADEQIDACSRAPSHRFERVPWKEDTVDDRKKRQRDHAWIGPSLRDLFGGCQQCSEGNRFQRLSSARRDSQRRGETICDALGMVDRVHMHAAALHDGPVEQSGRRRRTHQGRETEAAGGLTEQRDVAGVTPELRNVVAHPPQRRNLIVEPPVPDVTVRVVQPSMSQKPERTQPVVDGDDNDVAIADEVFAPIEEDRATSRRESAAVDPHHDRTAAVRESSWDARESHGSRC